MKFYVRFFYVLKSLRTGEQATCKNASYQNNKTKPRPLFTEATLLNAMDNIVDYVTTPHIKDLLKAKDKGKKKGQKGIGTQATRASFVPLMVRKLNRPLLSFLTMNSVKEEPHMVRPVAE